MKLHELEVRTNELNRRDEVLHQRLESMNDVIDNNNNNNNNSSINGGKSSTIVLDQQQQKQQHHHHLKDQFENEHAWWIYIWHQSQKRYQETEEYKNNQMSTDPHEHNTVLQAQAIEIATLRQVS